MKAKILFHPLVYPQCLEQCQALSWYLISICWLIERSLDFFLRFRPQSSESSEVMLFLSLGSATVLYYFKIRFRRGLTSKTHRCGPWQVESWRTGNKWWILLKEYRRDARCGLEWLWGRISEWVITTEINSHMGHRGAGGRGRGMRERETENKFSHSEVR